MIFEKISANSPDLFINNFQLTNPMLCTTSRVSPRSVGVRWSEAELNTYAPIGIMTSGAGGRYPQ